MAVAMVVIVVSVIAGGSYLVFERYSATSGQNNPAACTMEAKLCPDGSNVGRTGPNCEFSLCPTAPDPTADWKTYTNTQYGFSFKYPSYAEVKSQPLNGIFASFDLIVSTVGETDEAKIIRMRGYSKDVVGDLDYFRLKSGEGDNYKHLRSGDILVEVVGATGSDKKILDAIKTTLKFTTEYKDKTVYNYPEGSSCSDVLRCMANDLVSSNYCKTSNDCETVYDDINNLGPYISEGPYLLINKYTDASIKNRISLGLVFYTYANQCYGYGYKFSSEELEIIKKSINCVNNKCVVADNLIAQKPKVKVPSEDTLIAIGQRNIWPIAVNSQYGYMMSYPTGWIYDVDRITGRLDDIVFCPPEYQMVVGKRIQCWADENPTPIVLVNCNPRNCQGSNVEGIKEYILGPNKSGRYSFKLVLFDQKYSDLFGNMVSTFKFTASE